MSSEEDFDSTPEVRRFVGEVSQGVCPYMFDRWLGPLLHRTSKLTVIWPSLQIRVCAYGMGILLRVVMRIRTNRPQIQPRMVMVAANLHTPSLNTFFSIGNFCKEVMFGV